MAEGRGGGWRIEKLITTISLCDWRRERGNGTLTTSARKDLAILNSPENQLGQPSQRRPE